MGKVIGLVFAEEHVKERIPCPYCDKDYANEAALKKHIEKEHPEKENAEQAEK